MFPTHATEILVAVEHCTMMNTVFLCFLEIVLDLCYLVLVVDPMPVACRGLELHQSVTVKLFCVLKSMGGRESCSSQPCHRAMLVMLVAHQDMVAAKPFRVAVMRLSMRTALIWVNR